jgi:16S rRNA processing protein RimM
MSDAAVWEAMILVGRIARPQGNRGEVVVAPETDFGAQRFESGAVLQILRGAKIETLTVKGSREHQGRWVVGFEGIDSIDEAEELRGLELRIPPEALLPLEAGTYYVHDLAGLRVETTTGAVVGRVDHVLFAGTPLLVVEGARGEVLVPFVAAICRSVDLAAGLIVIDAPSGLLEANARATIATMKT